MQELGNGEAGWQFADRWTEELAQTEVTLPVRPDRVTSLPLDLDALFLTNQRGVFLLVAEGMRDGERQYPTVRKVVVWTDMGLLAHWQDDALVVFAHDLYSLAPLTDAAVTVHSRKNQVLATGATGAGGIAHLTGFTPSVGSSSTSSSGRGATARAIITRAEAARPRATRSAGTSCAAIPTSSSDSSTPARSSAESPRHGARGGR